MDKDKIIEEYIEGEKKIEPSPYIYKNIIRRIEKKPASKYIILLRSIAAAASIALVVTIGITMGNAYNISKSDSMVLINDSQIENFLMMIDYENE